MKNKKEVISYLVFGVLTTLVNIVSYFILVKFMGIDYKWATTIAWVLSVLFAFITNKLYVFNSRRMGVAILAKEFVSFVFFRLLSYFIDIGMMILLVEWLKVDDVFAKVAANVVVIVMNFFASKLFVFKTEN
ncbi:GtrA family protein [Neobacillus niacini]|uniref:GtrA family protein n=1 Tax=Neobacillus niacini TaxID=86668 RepID=UPI0021CB4D98|nr:GtrA family protein [Neobacillus niacini]MCM3763509.1 GtrA family protein [Neobacillus niacini]